MDIYMNNMDMRVYCICTFLLFKDKMNKTMKFFFAEQIFFDYFHKLLFSWKAVFHLAVRYRWTGYANPSEISCSSHVVLNRPSWKRRCLRKIYFLAKGGARAYVLVKKNEFRNPRKFALWNILLSTGSTYCPQIWRKSSSDVNITYGFPFHI